jgi:hypothetical protein
MHFGLAPILWVVFAGQILLHPSNPLRDFRSVQSGPLEIRIATLLRKSASDRQPSGCPAKTFKMVTWKLTVATSTIDQLRALQGKEPAPG